MTIRLAWIVCAAVSSAAVAQTSAYDCDGPYDRRKVEIRHYREDDAPRCEVNYYTDQRTRQQRLWWFRNDLPQCEVKAQQLLERLRAGGFTCVAEAAAGVAPPEPPRATIEPSRLAWGVAWAPRFGPRVEYPTRIFSVEEPPPENKDGIGYRSSDGRDSFALWGASNVLGYSPAQAASDSREAFIERKAVVTSFVQQENWFAMSAIEGDRVVHQKAMIVDDGRIVLGLTIEYPQSQQAFLEPIVRRMAESLSAGPAVERCPATAPPRRPC